MSEEGNEEKTSGAKQEKNTELSDEQLDEAAGAGDGKLQDQVLQQKSLEVDATFDIGDVQKSSDVELADTENLLPETGPADY